MCVPFENLRTRDISRAGSMGSETNDEQTLREGLAEPLLIGASPTRPCEYFKSKGVNFLYKILAMAKCSTLSRRLVGQMTRELASLAPRTSETHDIMDCVGCRGFMSHPVCLPCGHSHCRTCLDRPSNQARDPIVCMTCKESHPRIPLGFMTPRKPTLLLQSVSQKWYPSMVTACQHREEGNKHARDNNFQLALCHYQKALETGVLDHRVFGNSSRAQMAVGKVEAALDDAEKCCSLKPLWPKGHYRRGIVLNELGRYNEAAAAFLLCLHLDSGNGGSDPGVLRLLCEIIDKDLSGFASHEQQSRHPLVVTAFEQLMYYCTRSSEALVESKDYGIDSAKIEAGDFECVLCAGLLFNPVTTPCGHTFCQSCLARLFDHTPYCPVCRAPLGETFSHYTHSSGSLNVNVTLDQLIRKYFPEQYHERVVAQEVEIMHKARIGICDTEEVPIFVCTMGFPGMPCPLHIFEPRYRLMIRRCIESSRRFGMCAPKDESGSEFVSTGTILFISSLEYTPDGRSLVTTLGEKRFRVLGSRSTDGYITANIQFVSDEVVEGSDAIAYIRALQLDVYEHCGKWLEALPVFTRMLMMQNSCSPPPHVDPCPENCPNGPAWVWWFISAVPSSPQRRLQFLETTSLKERLLMLRETLPLPTS